jgi:hypothetical protein
MVSTTPADHSRASVRALKTVGIAALWITIAADFAGILPRSTPQRFDVLLASLAAVCTITAIYGSRPYEAIRGALRGGLLFGAMRLGRQIERQRQQINRRRLDSSFRPSTVDRRG